MMFAKIVAAGIAAVLVAAFAGVGRPEQARGTPEQERSVTVTGTGTVSVVPTRAHFSFGVESRGTSAAGALSANAAATRKVIDALKAAGIDAGDIQTEQVSLSTLYSDDGRSITGYAASNSVGVVVRRLGQAGRLVDEAVAAGANNVSGPSLDTGDRADLYREALAAAVADARAKAETVARESGLTLGRATIVQEGVPEAPDSYADRAAVAAAESTPIEPGKGEVAATVTVTFAAS
jgi:uncharacterized protein YggE